MSEQNAVAEINQELMIRKDVDEILRNESANTHQLAKSIAALLFYKYGEQPNGNRVYQLHRKGSPNTTYKAIAEFFDGIRKITRSNHAYPGIPDALHRSVGDMVTAFWQLAIDEAHKALEQFKEDSRAEVAKAQMELQLANAARQAAEDRADEYAQQRDESNARLADASDEIAHLRQRLDDTLAEMDARLEVANEAKSEVTLQLQEALQRLAEVERANGEEIARLSRALTASDDAVTRLKLDVNREITRSENYRTELVREREDNMKLHTTFARKSEEMNATIGNLREEVASIRGELKSTHDALGHAISRADALQESNTSLSIRLADTAARLEHAEKEREHCAMKLSKIKDSH